MIREISLYSINSSLTDIHPLEKLSLTIISLIGASYINNNYILGINILFFIILNILSKNPKSIINKFICIALFFGTFTALSLWWQGYDFIYILTLVLRGINGALSIGFLTLTTPINHIVYLMSKNKWTRDIGDIMKSMERFIIIIEEDFSTTFKAIKSRAGFCGCKNSIRDFGRTCGLVFKSLIFRWREINLSLKNRCYIGRHNYYYQFESSKYRVAFIIGYFILVNLCCFI